MGDGGPADAIPVDETRFEQGDVTWSVRVSGRSGGSGAGTPLLLLGFRREVAGDTADEEAGPEREALVVGTSLDQLGEEGLRAALAVSRPPPPPPEARPPERPPRPRRRGRGRR